MACPLPPGAAVCGAAHGALMLRGSGMLHLWGVIIQKKRVLFHVTHPLEVVFRCVTLRVMFPCNLFPQSSLARVTCSLSESLLLTCSLRVQCNMFPQSHVSCNSVPQSMLVTCPQSHVSCNMFPRVTV
ncbi:hypothetical protein AVEN_242076-1 [Araneus ventricosus]|uniref:Uncharacterized protein n=1 Tax=Araneus ventricosus TaxID=182803 RepID=A0A4Y2T8Q6_ARAVE|nr:hypothetical protein AVEN_242076-1 [Araneus ventricosus]